MITKIPKGGDLVGIITKIPKGGDLVRAKKPLSPLEPGSLAFGVSRFFSRFLFGGHKEALRRLDAKTESALRRFLKIPRRSLSSACSGTTVRHIVPIFPEISPTI